MSKENRKSEIERKISRLNSEAIREMVYQNNRSSLTRSYSEADMLFKKANELRRELNNL